jgi:hypothetical protein
MTKIISKSFFLLIIIILCAVQVTYSQSISSIERINYQALLKNSDGTNVSAVFPFPIKFTLRIGNTGTLLFQEIHQVSSLNEGLVNLLIGEGTSTGAGLYNQLDEIYPFQDSLTLTVEIDINGGGYQLFEQRLLKSVAFAGYSKYSLDTLLSGEMQDVQLPALINDVLKWNGSKWVPSIDIPTVSNVAFSYNSDSAANADTSVFAQTDQHINTDTALYSYIVSSSLMSLNASNAATSDSSQYSNVTNTADSVIFAWHLTGNHNLPQFDLGTQDSNDFIVKTNNVERLRIYTNGRVYAGTDTVNTDFFLKGSNGFLFTKATGNTIWYDPSIGTKLAFVPLKAALNMGTVSDNRWQDTTMIGMASFAFGYNCLSNGKNSSIVFGDSCEINPILIPPPAPYNLGYIDGIASFALGKNCKAHGRMAFASGYRSEALFFRGVAMGYMCKTDMNSANIAIGYMAKSYGSTAASFGYKTFASGHRSTVLGASASSNGKDGSFVYGDASTTDTVKNSAANQFMIRASGGIIFYTDGLNTTGTEIAPGGGSWSTLSDVSKKENIVLIEPGSYTNLFLKLNIYTWNYKTQNPAIRHIGPTAQEFKRLYNFGENNTSISLVDADGITLHAIQSVDCHLKNIQNNFYYKLPKLKAELQEMSYSDLDLKLKELKLITDTLAHE